MRKEYTYKVNGFETTVYYEDTTVEQIFLPLLRKWSQMCQKLGRRVIVFLAAPPGTGKSTIAEFMKYLSETETGLEKMQAVGLDGFHYHQDYILSHDACVEGRIVPMKEIKGCPESYDIEKLRTKLSELKAGDAKFPVYDRNIHDVVEEAVAVTEKIVLIEGNWLLLDEEPWAQLMEYCDDSIFIGADESLLKDRLIQRKMRGGLAAEAAEAYYERVDRKNVRRLMEAHHTAGTNLVMQPDGNYIFVEDHE
ncbi:MAG: nucleoside/nucleotide kinase family protein [Lachnospiraceae bacterium]|nr:nucleoside/nucleotide kinase family protein [Lachnospiraceae bacterium]